MNQLSIEELPYSVDSASLFAQIKDLGQAIWLDSSAPYSSRGRYDIFASSPIASIKKNKSKQTNSYSYSDDLNLFNKTSEAMKELLPSLENDYHLPFMGGAMGYFGYDLGRQLAQLDNITTSNMKTADTVIGIYSWSVIVDHRQKRSLLVAHPQTNRKQLLDIKQRLLAAKPATYQQLTLDKPFQSNFTEDSYRAAFNQIQDYILAGDCYQINLAQRFSTEYSGDPFAGYLALRKVAAAPFSAYIEHEDGNILCMSPERFLQVNKQRVTTSPIKGTIGRGQTREQDDRLAQQLINSSKDRAENLMIVDLLRNDLGKACQPGSIHVSELFELQSFETVHHLVSTISGQLRDDKTAIDLLSDCFPGGSITGAPKIRAMQIIEELEPNRRSAYCGSIGYISCDGQMDTNIAIRTMICEQNAIHCWAGGGIVADSECDSEYEECMTKVGSLMAALEK